MPDIPDNVPIYVSSDYGDDEQSSHGAGATPTPLSREQLMNDRPPATWAPYSPGESKAAGAADLAAAAASTESESGRVKSDEELAQSGFQSFRLPRAENEKVVTLSPRTVGILVAVSSFNFLLFGLWLGANFLPREPVVSSFKPGVESLFGLLGQKKGKAMTDPTNLVAEVVAKAAPAVVNIDVKFNRIPGAINNLDENGSMPSGEGSGLIVSSDGYIVTNSHVISGAGDVSEIKVTLSDDKVYKAKAIGSDPFTDIAVIKIDATGLPVLKFGSSLDVHAGDWAIAIGSPLGFDHTVSLGVVSAVDRSLSFFNNRVSLIQHDAALNFGNSGGPLLNIKGEVIGINTAVKEKAQGIGFATPIDVVNNVVPQLIQHGAIPRPFLGIFMKDIDPDHTRSQTLPSHPVSVKVSGLIGDGPALKAGVCGGDFIIKVQGHEVHSAKEVRDITHDMKPGDTLEMQVKRPDGKGNFTYPTCKVILGDYSKLNLPH